VSPEGPSLELHLAPGTANVPLPEAPGTGYLWTPEALPEGVSLVRTEYIPPDRGKMGGEGERIFVLEVSPGRHVLRFRLARAGERDAVENRTVTLVVAPAG
jgi:predicted secreted protein